jgi:hypothetical protein
MELSPLMVVISKAGVSLRGSVSEVLVSGLEIFDGAVLGLPDSDSGVIIGRGP